jgi:hypothetical protein
MAALMIITVTWTAAAGQAGIFTVAALAVALVMSVNHADYWKARAQRRENEVQAGQRLPARVAAPEHGVRRGAVDPGGDVPPGRGGYRGGGADQLGHLAGQPVELGAEVPAAAVRGTAAPFSVPSGPTACRKSSRSFRRPCRPSRGAKGRPRCSSACATGCRTRASS